VLVDTPTPAPPLHAHLAGHRRIAEPGSLALVLPRGLRHRMDGELRALPETKILCGLPVPNKRVLYFRS